MVLLLLLLRMLYRMGIYYRGFFRFPVIFGEKLIETVFESSYELLALKVETSFYCCLARAMGAYL